MEALAFCPHCRKEIGFTTADAVDATELDGVEYSYPVKQALCVKCGNEAVYQPYEEAAAHAFNDAVRRSKGLVSLDVVRDLPKRYRIGKRPLSKLLGWGEITYTRFVDGQAPSKEYSNVIERLHDDPEAYYRLLVRGKNRITEVAYRKSEQAVKEIIGGSFSHSERLYEVADYFCALAEGDITPLMIQKLTYYTQGFSYVFLDAPLFREEPFAEGSGPVYRQITKECEGRDLVADGELLRELMEDALPFSEDEESLLRAIFESFGQYSGAALTSMAREEELWRDARERASKEGAVQCASIRLSDMKRFFIKEANRLGIGSPEEIGRYARAAFAAADFGAAI